ncbi:aspartic peptidase domain superfamily [Holotrichia oblita]|uniref:Aspartic peptidase domain superfamily n=1 Tax=Holotrichia oblita TaxID=644536 RepID=A0ACB9T999_HOLOL|nr:aspartic peptidase domain superfamily [Holotrichia oblita]
MADSGADWSVIHHHVVKSVGTVIIPSQQKLAGLQKELQALGRCMLYVGLQEITLEIDFLVIPDGTIPGVEALIGWETILQPGIKIVVRKHGLDLQHSETKPQIRIVKTQNKTEDGSTKGKYTFVDPEGVKHTIEYYAAAEHGVDAKGADVPVPVSDTLENVVARKQFLETFGAIANDPRFAESPLDDNEDPIDTHEYLAALKEQLHPSVPLVFQADTPEIAAAKAQLVAAHVTAVGH